MVGRHKSICTCQESGSHTMETNLSAPPLIVRSGGGRSRTENIYQVDELPTAGFAQLGRGNVEGFTRDFGLR